MPPPSGFCPAPPLPTGIPRSQCITPHTPPHCAAKPPKRIGAVAKDLRQALQACLTARTSRIAVQLPAGANLGTEKRSGSETEAVITSDRELARLLAGMFERTGLAVRVIFPGPCERAAAQRVWGPLVECQIVDWGGKKGKGKLTAKNVKTTGFGKAVAKEEAQADADVYIVVGGGAGFLSKTRKLADSLGPDKLVIVANPNSARDKLPLDLQVYREEAFEAVYHYEPNPHPKWSGSVLFRKFPDDWVLCRLSGIGMLQQLLVSTKRPSIEEIGNALSKEGQKSGNSLLNKISTFIDRNV